ncbi:MAG: hypothetical protein ACRECP_12455 [Methylocella sp.]
MQHKLIIGALLVVLLTALAGCATYKTTLADAQGRTATCEASGKNGIVTGYFLRRGFEDCIAAAKAQGFKESSQDKFASNGSRHENLSNPAANLNAAQ